MSVLRPQLEHAETCSTAEAARGHYACVHAVVCGMKLADPGITSEPRDLPLRNQGWLMFSPPLLSQDAVLPWTCAWTPPLQRQLAEMLHWRHSIASWRTTEMKSENSDHRTFIAARLCALRTGGRIQPSIGRFSTQQTSLPVGMGSICRRSPFIAGGSTESISLSCGGGQPWLARFSQTPLRGRCGSSLASLTEPCITGDIPALDGTGGLGCTTLTSTAPTLTQHYQVTMTTSSPSRVFRRNPCGLPVSSGSVFLFGPARCTAPSFFLAVRMAFPLDQGFQLDSLWSQPMVQRRPLFREIVLRIMGCPSNSYSTRSPWKFPSGSGVARCSSLSRLISCSAGVRVLAFSVTLRRRRKPSSFLCSCWTCRTGDGPPLMLLLLWSLVTFIPWRLRISSPVSCSQGGIWTWLHSFHRRQGPGPPQPVRTLPSLLTALAASLDRLRPHNALTIHTSWTVQEVIAAEARLLESIHYEVGTCTPADWAHLLATRFSLKAEQLGQRTPSVVRSPPSLLMSWQVEHSVSLQALLGTAPSRSTSHPPWVLRVVCLVFALGVTSTCWGPLGMTQRCFESHSWTLTSCPLLRAW